MEKIDEIWEEHNIDKPLREKIKNKVKANVGSGLSYAIKLVIFGLTGIPLP